MTERAEPPMTFGGTGGLVWRLRPDDGALATTRRSRPDPSAPDALRPPALGPPTRLASCGRRWDTALSPERVELAAALASRVADRALASAASAPRSRVRDAVPDPADVPSDADSDSDSDSDSDDARPDYRLDYETFEARAALLRGHPPVGVPRRVLRRGVAESHAASLRPAPCAFANALAVAPWPGRGLDEGGDLILAHTGGENAVELRVTRLSLAHPTRDASTRPAVRALGTWRVPTRAAAQPVLQIELATLPNGSGWFGGEDHAPPALCATRDRHGAALCAVGGGAGNPPREVGTPPGAGTPRSPRDEHGHPRERSCGRSRPSTRATPPRTSRSIHTACPRCWWRPRTARCVAWTPPAVLARAGRAPRGAPRRLGRGRVVGVRVRGAPARGFIGDAARGSSG